METFNTVLRFLQNGGSFMYPIGFVLFLGLAISFERFIVLTKAKFSNKSAFNVILPMLQRKDLNSVVRYGKENGAPVARILSAGIARMANARRREDIEYAMEEGVLESMSRLEKRTGYLATLANISTLLGLLGTIIGLIAAFTAVANADATEKATLLSQSISLAMNTTAFGLIAAIPLLLFHSLLQTRTSEIVDSLEMASVKCINMVFAPAESSKETNDKQKNKESSKKSSSENSSSSRKDELDKVLAEKNSRNQSPELTMEPIG